MSDTEKNFDISVSLAEEYQTRLEESFIRGNYNLKIVKRNIEKNSEIQSIVKNVILPSLLDSADDIPSLNKLGAYFDKLSGENHNTPEAEKYLVLSEKVNLFILTSALKDAGKLVWEKVKEMTEEERKNYKANAERCIKILDKHFSDDKEMLKEILELFRQA